jgi:signal transduction histidine kinase/streptogramin lyase
MRLGKAFAMLLSASWAVARPAAALDPAKSLSQCTVDVWQVRDGLPGAMVRSIAQTPDGYLWINTFGGVARYDGARLTRLEGPRAAELSLHDVQEMRLTEGGTLFLAPAYSDPLCMRNEALGPCLGVPTGLLPADRVLAASVRGGEIWMASKQRLTRFEDGKRTAQLTLAELGWPRIQVLHQDRQGRLWVGTPGGLFARSGERFDAVPAVTGSVLAISETPGGRLWVATSSSVASIDGERFLRLGREDGLPAARPTKVLEDRDGNVWIGTEAGLVRYRDRRFVTFGTQDGLPDAHVTAVFEDREGSLWVGTHAGGLAQFTDRTLVTQAGPPLARGQDVDTLCEDEQGALWVGTRESGALRWQDGRSEAFTTREGLPSNTVRSVLPGAPGEVWIGTNRGLARWREGRIERPVPWDSNVSSLYRDRAGTLWIGADSGAVARWREDRLEEVGAPEAGRWGQVRGIQEDDQGRLLVLAVGGLARHEGGRLVRLTPSRGPATVWGRSLSRDSEGTLWIGTIGNGLTRIEKGAFRTFSSAQGIVPDQLYQVVVDDEGFVWAGTMRGIIRVSKASLVEVEHGRRQRADLVSFERSDQRRNVAAVRVHQPGAWKARDGRLLFATEQGVVTIDPRRLRSNPVAPSVLVQEATVDGHRLRRAERNQLPPGPGNLEFQYAAITLLEPEKAVHRYLLEGFDERWVDAGTRRVAYYTNIPAGHYRFRVQASNADGLWNEAGDAIEFHLAPHFYRTGWFYGLGGVGVLSLGRWFHRSRVRRVRAETLAAAAERTRVARELHDTLLQEMSGVAMMLNAVRTTLPAAAAGVAEKLGTIESTVTASLAETRRVVWDLRERPEKEEAGADLGAALTRLAARATSGQAVECKVSVEGAAAPLPVETGEELLRMAQEGLANALRHAGAGYINLRLCYEKGVVRLLVTDDGRGFDPDSVVAARAGHFGLVGLRERAARLGATLTLDSQPGRGTTVEVAVPVPAGAARRA